MPQEYRALAALPDDQTFSSKNCNIVTNNCAQLQGISHNLVDAMGTASVQLTDIHKDKAPICIR